MDMPSADTCSESVCDPAFLERLHTLRDKLLSLNHPHAEQVTEVRAEPGDCTILSEPLEGESLAQLLNRGVRLSFEEARTVIQQVSEALEAAHELGLAHGNLSPERIVFTRPLSEGPPQIKVRGFGVGKPLGNGLFGVPSYLAPEQVDPFSPQPEATPKSDQFALAALLAEMLTGRRAFDGETVEEVRSKLLHDDPRQVEWAGAQPEDARRVRKALERALSKQRTFRYEQLSDFVTALWPRSAKHGSQEGMSRLHQVPIQLRMSASLMLRIQDIPTVQTAHALRAQEDTQPALRPAQIHVVYNQHQPAEMEILRPDLNVTLTSLRPEAQTSRSVQPECQPPPPQGSRLGSWLRAGHLLKRLPSIGPRRRKSLGLGVALSLVVILAVQVLGSATPKPMMIPAPSPPRTESPQPLPHPEGPVGPKTEDTKPKKPERLQPVKRQALPCSFTATAKSQDLPRALLGCISPLRARLPLRGFQLKLDARDHFIMELMPPALNEQRVLECLYQARGKASQREALREGNWITCR